jgi:peptidoglycan/LPS O-acetylase OafA/YrhL
MDLQSYTPILIIVVAIVVAALLYRFMRARARDAQSRAPPPIATSEEADYLDSSHIIGPSSSLPPSAGRDKRSV